MCWIVVSKFLCLFRSAMPHTHTHARTYTPQKRKSPPPIHYKNCWALHRISRNVMINAKENLWILINNPLRLRQCKQRVKRECPTKMFLNKSKNLSNFIMHLQKNSFYLHLQTSLDQKVMFRLMIALESRPKMGTHAKLIMNCTVDSEFFYNRFRILQKILRSFCLFFSRWKAFYFIDFGSARTSFPKSAKYNCSLVKFA